MIVWHPDAIIRRYKYSGGSMVGGPPRITMHSTETTTVPRYGQLLGANSAPHFTIDRDGTVYQHQPLNVASRSLRNESGGVQTNRQGKTNVQIERVGYAREGHNIPVRQLVTQRNLVRWIAEQTGTPMVWRRMRGGPHCYGSGSICRMSAGEWLLFTGICAHAEVTENTHWDVGAADFAVLFGSDPEETHVVQRGDTGDLVRFYQQALDAWLDSAGLAPIDYGDTGQHRGIFGPDTERAVKQYEAAADVPIRGVIDGALAAALATYHPRVGQPSPTPTTHTHHVSEGIPS